ncbi:hypothetical protein [Kitasatospora cineracea]|uniref:Ig-like domain-containing protein n=1 Tax=Kitasatospora cineracea TaxID=88074 RepID=A0A3N4RAI3_9ACTN|nr:hypothetical protein [Kitasatospora cineracea]RPE27985.1 hypothetical protein EDD38_7291 [Kitasatospora cineracea]
MRHKALAAMLSCLLTTAAACALPHGNDPNTAACWATFVPGHAGIFPSDSLRIRCAPALTAFRVVLQLQYAAPVPFRADWHLETTSPPDTRVPGTDSLTYTVSADQCSIGFWRLDAEISGTNPDGTPMTPPSIGSAQARTTMVSCA